MKKYLIGLVVGLIVALPAGVFAWSLRQEAAPIVGFDCQGPYYETKDGMSYTDANGKALPDNAAPIKNPNGTDGRCSGTVYRFTDSGNTCYVAKGSNAGGIYCVK